MNIKYDSVADAVYVKVSNGKIAKTLKMEDRLIVDVDNKNNVVGIEILAASAQGRFLKNLRKNARDGVPVKMSPNRLVAA